MVGIIILCVIGALLCVLLFTPIHVRASYDQGEVSARVRFGPVALPLYAREASEPKARKPKKEKPPEGTAAEGAKNQKKGMKVNREQLLYTLEKLPPVLGRALRRTGRRIRIRPLKLHVLVAGSDPADTAALYGRLEAALAADSAPQDPYQGSGRQAVPGLPGGADGLHRRCGNSGPALGPAGDRAVRGRGRPQMARRIQAAGGQAARRGYGYQETTNSGRRRLTGRRVKGVRHGEEESP